MTMFGENAGGPPLKYNPEQLEKKIMEYFENVDKENVQRKLKRDTRYKPYTISGICVYLDISKETWNRYSKQAEYHDPIKRCKARVENYVEEGVLNGSLNSIGGIFNLKNNFGWVDKTEVTFNKEPEKLSLEDIKGHLKEKKRLENKSE